MDPPELISDAQLEDIVLHGKASLVARTFAAKDPCASKFIDAMTSFKARGTKLHDTVKILLQDCNAALEELDKHHSQQRHHYTTILNARRHLICLADPSSSQQDVAAACVFFNEQPRVIDHISHLESVAEDEGGAIETVSQAGQDAPDLPSHLSNERFSLDQVLNSQFANVNISSATRSIPDDFLPLLLPLSIAQGNTDESIRILNSLNSTSIWPTSIPSTSHLKQHRGSPKASSIFAPFTRGSGCAIICFSQYSTVISNTPIAAGTKAYFEVHVLSSGPSPQFGLATEKFPQCSDYSADGVGDDVHSWAVDGVRHQFLHKGGAPADKQMTWSEGDVLGFAVDTSAFKCDVSVNGRTIITFDISDAKDGGLVGTLFPAFTGSSCCIKVNFGEDPFCHPSFSQERLLTAAPPADLAPLLVETIVQYLQAQRSVKGTLISDPVSVWNLDANRSLRQNLSLDQMWQIAKLCPQITTSASFLKGLFERQDFAPQDLNTFPGSPQHILQICTTAEAVVRRLPDTVASIALSLRARIFFHRLESMQKLGTCDGKLLEQYLEMKRTHFLEICGDKDALVRQGASWNSASFAVSDIHILLPLKPINTSQEHRTIQSCLSILFSPAHVTTYQPWDSYVFPSEVAELVFLDAKACAGDVKAAASLNAKFELAKKLTHIVTLRFFENEGAKFDVLPSSPPCFNADDVAFVNVEMKGISSLSVNVFAIDYESYCKTGATDVNTTFSVEGLLPLWTESILFDHLPHVFHRETIRFPQMKGRGIWLVDMIGSELISRAIIRKGDSFVVSRLTPHGTSLSLHDIQQACVPISGAKFWFEGREFVSGSDGCAIIPFMNRRKSGIVAASAPGGFACAKSVEFIAETWDATISIIAPHEAFVPGCATSVVLRCALFLTSHRLRMPLSELQSPSISLDAQNENGIVIQSSSSKVTFSDSGDLLIPWTYPAGCCVLEVTLTASVALRSTVNDAASIRAHASVKMPPSPSAFESKTVAVIQAASTRSDVIVPHLRLGRGKYWLDVLYCSGHPVAGHSFEILVSTIASKNPFSFNLKSDQDGRVDLGALRGVKSVSALGFAFPVTTQRITPTCDRVVVPYRRDGTVFLPANLISPDLFTLFEGSMHQVLHRSVGNSVIATLPHAIRSSESNGVVINIPPPGIYSVRLFCSEGMREISMKVASSAAGSDFLSLYQGVECEVLQPFVPSDCRFKGIDSEGSDLVVAVDGSNAVFEKMSINVWLCNSFPLVTCFTEVRAPIPESNKGTKSLNNFESGLKLGHESLYILNRKKQKISWLGISLPRPSLVALPLELGSVDTQIMKARDNQAFLGQSSARAFAPQPPAYNPASPAYSPCSPGYSPSSPAYHAIPAYCYDAKPKGGGEETVSKKSMSRCRMQPGAPKSVASGHPRVEHLASAALLCSNIRLDASGTAVIKLPADFDGVALVMLTCESSCEWKIVHSSSLPSAPPPTLLQRQLCLNQTFAPESHMCLQPSSRLLASGEEMLIINDVGGVYTSIEDLCPLLNASNMFPLAADIVRWSAMPIQEKTAFYSKHACHELHLFLNAHDPSFFAAHVAPVIANRLDPDFIDLFLSARDISGFASVSRCESLNVCEKILLARAMGGRIGAAIALDIVRRCSALDVAKDDWKDSVRLNAAMSFGIFARGVADQTDCGEEEDGGGGEEDEEDDEEFIVADGDEMSDGYDEDGCVTFGPESELPPKPTPKCPAPKAKAPAPKAAAPVMYQPVGKVKQIAEQRWKQVPQPSVFFRDLASHMASCISSGKHAPFVSSSVATAHDSALVALSFISLPLSTSSAAVAKLQRRTQDGVSSLFLIASGLCLRYFKDTVAVAPPPDTRCAIVGQHIVESVFEPAVGQTDATVGKQGCLVGRPYALRTIVTNVSDKDISVHVLTQIPSSSMPLYGALHTNVQKLKVPSFSVKVVNIWFFFPLPGSARIYPAQVTSTSGECIGCAEPVPNVPVCSSFSVSAESSWSLIVTHGSEDQLVAALTSDLSLLRMRVVHTIGRLAQSPALLRSIFKILRDNHMCVPVVWALALAGRVREAAVEFLTDIVPPSIMSSLVGSSVPLPIPDNALPFSVFRPCITSESGLMTGVCDFDPVFNARTHALGSYGTIAVEAMRIQYRRILWKVAIDPVPARSDCIQIAYLLALQDRFSESWAFLNALEEPGFTNAPSKNISELYLLAYLAMSHPDDAVLAAVPSIMPLLRSRCARSEWARRVDVLQEQLTESFGGKAQPPSAADIVRMRPHTAKAPQVDAFAFSIQVRNESKMFVDVIASGLTCPSTARIKVFHLDIEVIFSNHPFLVAGRDNIISAGSMFAAVAPHVIIEEALDAGSDSADSAAVTTCRRSVELPPLPSCFFLAVECNGVKTSQTVFKSRMTVSCAEQLGLITVTNAESSAPARNAYVKVFIKLKTGGVEFFKDGYTDRRGKFDYVSLNTGQMQHAEDIAILVCCADGDCNVTRASPPAGI